MAEASIDFNVLYHNFDAPISTLDCGMKCAPHNINGVPFCCDTHHAVPTVYQAEWEFLQENTDLWHLWHGENEKETARLAEQTPPGLVLVECQGHLLCQRGFRSITCRSFPFYPYIDKTGMFLGISYYWEYEDRCWVISNLGVVTKDYRDSFIAVFEHLFKVRPQEFENFKYHSMIARRIFGRKHKTIPLLHRNGNYYKITPRNGRLRKVSADQLPKFEPYSIADKLRFADER